MELFDQNGCLTEEGLHAVIGGQLDELGRLEAAEHLSYCDKCMDRYTALLTADVLEEPPRSARGAVMGTIWVRLMQNTWGRAAVAAVAAVLALTMWRTGTLEQILSTGETVRSWLPETTQTTEPEQLDDVPPFDGGTETAVELLVRNQAVDNTITVEDVRTRMEEQYPLAVPAFEQALADSGVERNDRVTVSPSRIKKLESRSFKTESGIEIKIPAELCNSDDAVEFIHSATGGLSLLIKDVLV